MKKSIMFALCIASSAFAQSETLTTAEKILTACEGMRVPFLTIMQKGPAAIDEARKPENMQEDPYGDKAMESMVQDAMEAYFSIGAFCKQLAKHYSDTPAVTYYNVVPVFSSSKRAITLIENIAEDYNGRSSVVGVSFKDLKRSRNHGVAELLKAIADEDR